MNDNPIEEEQQETAEEVVEEPEAAPEQETVEAVVEGPRLVLKRSGQETDVVFPFSAPATIGRFDPSVGPIDIDLGQIEEGSYVSRKHARITVDGETFKIEDLGSSNGTYVLRDEFEKVEEAEIADGDEISLGNARFVFHV